MNNDFTGEVLKAGVLGWPIAQSKSPRMHNHWLKQHNLNGVYLPFAVKPEDFSVAVRGLQAAGLKGCNVTIPHKKAAFDIADRLSPAAQAIGAVNTLVFDGDGTIFGHNTDGEGFMENLRQWAPNHEFADSNAFVLGAGGAAQAIIFALLEAGVSKLYLYNRSQDKAETLAKAFGQAYADRIQVITADQKAEALAQSDLLVNTTSLGMVGQPALDLDLSPLASTALVTDIVYNPLETDLLAQAKAKGNPTVDGLGMLLHQAVAGFELWFGVRPKVDATLRDLMLA